MPVAHRRRALESHQRADGEIPCGDHKGCPHEGQTRQTREECQTSTPKLSQLLLQLQLQTPTALTYSASPSQTSRLTRARQIEAANLKYSRVAKSVWLMQSCPSEKDHARNEACLAVPPCNRENPHWPSTSG